MPESAPNLGRLRRLGRHELTLPAVGLGCAALGDSFAARGAGGARVLLQALAAGPALLELGFAAGAVGGVVRRALAGRRDHAVVVAGDASGEVARSCDRWLRELGTDHLDLFYVRRCERDVEDVADRLGELVRAGKVRHIGLSGVSAGELRRAHRVHPVTAIVEEYSLMHRGIEAQVLPAARSSGIGVIAARPLGRGFLTGRIRGPRDLSSGDPRQRDARFRGERLLRGAERLPPAEELAAELDVSLARLALAWVLTQGDDIVAVPGTSNPLHLEMNMAAPHVRLTPEQRTRLERVFGG
jgi:aryl-alcohol dehydrogenase-like predicted oxidoreductase